VERGWRGSRRNHYTRNPVNIVSEGARIANEGAVNTVPSTQASQGDYDENSLLMPEMINLESAGLR